MLISSFGFSLDVHFCGDEIKSVGFFGADECEMENALTEKSTLPPCHRMSEKSSSHCKKSIVGEQQVKTPPCCHNETFNYEASTELNKSVLDLEKVSNVSAVLVYVALINHLFSFEKEQVSFYNYKPPLIDQDISVLYQVFRI